MSGVKHTPGPWRVFTVQDGPNKGQLLGIGEEVGTGVADAHGGLWGSGDEKMANARLIAAAPDLLEALKKSTEGWANALELGLLPPQHRDTATILRDEAWSAISRATGQAGGGE